jgi:hypothetical protein
MCYVFVIELELSCLYVLVMSGAYVYYINIFIQLLLLQSLNRFYM